MALTFRFSRELFSRHSSVNMDTKREMCIKADEKGTHGLS